VKEGGICKRKDQRAVVIFVERKSEAGGDQEVVNCVTKRGVGSAARRGIRRGLHHRFPNLPPTRRKRQIHKLRGEPLRTKRLNCRAR
jgi:hypothetical protein